MPTMQLTGRRFAFAVAFLPATAWSAVHAQAPTVAPPATNPARQAPPAPGTPKDFRVPPRRSFDLPNGMRVTLVPYGRVPKAAVELTVRTGIIDEGPQDVSLSQVTTDMLLEGTTTRTPQDISREAADMGGSLRATGGAEAMTLGGEVLSDFVPGFVALVADVVRNPRLDAADLARTLDKHARDNAMSLAQPGTLAQKRFREIAYGNHPFARVFPTEEMLRGFTVARVREFHAKQIGAKRAHLYVSGVFNAAAVEKAVRDAFGSWTAGAPPTENPPVPVARRQLELIDRPGAVQSSMWMGLPVANPTSSDWTAMQVTDALLGGAFGSRITSNIREDKGYTYSPFSFLWTRKGSSLWVEVADVTTKDTGNSLTEIFKEMERLRTEAPPAKELDGIKNNMAGVFTIQNSSRSGLIGQLQFADLHGLGDDYLGTYVKKVLAVTPEDVRGTAQKHLDPARVSVAIVGDKKVVEPQLGQFKPIVP
ncbi:MAG: insulinase family protein [Gemmatimonadetes bacterium]|nr:insulinase family protein [Gemmatimonadota bacterium]